MEIFPADDQKLAPEDRWFAEMTENKLVSSSEGKACRAMWCKVNTLARETPIQNTEILLHHLKDHGTKSMFSVIKRHTSHVARHTSHIIQ